MADFMAIATLTAAPGAGEKLLAHLTQLRNITLEETHALDCSVVTAQEDPRVYILIETFDSAEGFRLHQQNPEVREVSEAMSGATAAVDIRTGQVVRS